MRWGIAMGAFAAVAAISMEAAAQAAVPEGVEQIDVARVPTVTIEPDPIYENQTLTAAERAAGRPIDYGRDPIARFAKPGERAAAAVIRARSLMHPDSHGAHGWTRFLQSNWAAPAVSFNCGRGEDLDRAVDTWRLAPGAGGAMVYSYDHAWFNFARCRGLLLRHYETPTLPVFGGLAYVYRTSCPRCAPEARHRLHLVSSAVDSGRITSGGGRFEYATYKFNHVYLPLAPGESATYNAFFSDSALVGWNQVVPAPLAVRDRRLRVEVSWAKGEAAPTVIAFAK